MERADRRVTYQVRRRSGGEFVAVVAPARLLVEGARGDAPQVADHGPVQSPTAALETLPPGGSSMNGMNLSGKPGIVHPMQMPPTFGQPPTPLIQPRLGTLHLTTGPQQPSLTMHFGDPYSVAKSPCS